MILSSAVVSRRPVLLVPRPGTDSYGDPVDDWSDPSRVPLSRATVQDRVSTEATEDGRPSLTRSTRVVFILGPSPAPITAESRFEIDGEVWHADGDPLVRRGFLDAHTVITLRRDAD